MKGFNFFSIYGAKKQKTNVNFKSKRVLIGTSVVSFLVVFGITFFLYQLFRIEGEISSINSYLDQTEIQDKLQKDTELRYRQQILDSYSDALSNLEMQKEKTDKVDVDMLYAIDLSKPENLIITYVGIANNSSQITGYCSNNALVSDFVESLKNQEIYPFAQVFLTNISWNELGYEFSIQINVE